MQPDRAAAAGTKADGDSEITEQEINDQSTPVASATTARGGARAAAQRWWRNTWLDARVGWWLRRLRLLVTGRGFGE